MTHPIESKFAASARKDANLCVLVAEPEEDVRTLYSKFLGTWNAGIVDTGEKCIELASKQGGSLDMIIIDSHILETGALETVSKIKELNPRQHIIITSTNATQFQERLKSAGITGDAEFVVEVIQKPFSFLQLLSLVRSKVPRTSKVKMRDHNLGIYSSLEEELAEAVEYVKAAIAANDTAALILRMDTDLEALKKRMHEAGIDVEASISNHSLFIFRNEDWYLPDRQLDTGRTKRQWMRLTDEAVQAGRNGVRVFCMMDCFFDHGLGAAVVDYEHTFPTRFEIPLASVCAYRKEDIDKLSDEQKQKLVMCHYHVWTGDKD